MQQLSTNDTKLLEQGYQHAIREQKIVVVRVGVDLPLKGRSMHLAELFERGVGLEAGDILNLQDEFSGVNVGCLLLEHAGDDSSLVKTIEVLLAQMKSVPLVVLGRSASVAQAVLALNTGACDYIDGSLASDDRAGVKLFDGIQRHIQERQDQVPVDYFAKSQHLPLALVSESTPYGAYSIEAAHQVLTPLAALQEFITLVLDGVAGPIKEEQGKFLAYARGACDQIRQAVDEFVGVNGLNPNYFATPAPQELGSVLLEAWSALASSADLQDLHLKIEKPALAQLVVADSDLLQQLLQTLLQDLTSFAEPGETIAVSTHLASHGEGPQLRVSLSVKPEAVEIDPALRTFSNRRRFGPWLVTQTLGRGMSYQLDLPTVHQPELLLSTKNIEEYK